MLNVTGHCGEERPQTVTFYSLDQVAGMLNPTQFFRVNRQFLVARSAIHTIHAYSAGKLKLDLLPVSHPEVFVIPSRITEFKDWLGR